MKWSYPFNRLTRKERKLHAIAWGVGLILINIPDWTITLGPFHSDDFSLIVPSLYGMVLNAYLFYSVTFEIEASNFGSVWDRVRTTVRVFIIVTCLESALDTLYFAIHYWFMDLETFTEILLGQLLMNFIFFYLPSIMFGFVKAWQKSESKPEDEPKLVIKDGPKKVYLPLNRLTHIESDGNYCIYHAGKKHMVRQTLTQAEEDLPDFFIRCHKSFIVNSKLIENQAYNELVVGGFIIPIGRKYRENLK